MSILENKLPRGEEGVTTNVMWGKEYEKGEEKKGKI
jgi:hypothetical protein